MVVRYRDKSSKPMKLPKAKVYALEMVKGIRPGLVIADPIGRLHRLHLDVQEPMPEIAQVWAIETADYPPPYSRSQAPTEPPVVEYQLEYHALVYYERCRDSFCFLRILARAWLLPAALWASALGAGSFRRMRKPLNV